MSPLTLLALPVHLFGESRSALPDHAQKRAAWRPGRPAFGERPTVPRLWPGRLRRKNNAEERMPVGFKGTLHQTNSQKCWKWQFGRWLGTFLHVFFVDGLLLLVLGDANHGDLLGWLQSKGFILLLISHSIRKDAIPKGNYSLSTIHFQVLRMFFFSREGI